MGRTFLGAIACSAAFVLSTGAVGANYATTIFGHKVYTTDQPGEDKLMIDGTARLTDGRIDIQEIGLAGDLPVVIGWVGSGGNMCSSVPFVVSFAGGAPKLTVSPLECFQMEWTLGDREIHFKTPGPDGIKFHWTHEDGFVELTQ